jgi:protein involved in polysaccharide export with SLBB domain
MGGYRERRHGVPLTGGAGARHSTGSLESSAFALLARRAGGRTLARVTCLLCLMSLRPLPFPLLPRRSLRQAGAALAALCCLVVLPAAMAQPSGDATGDTTPVRSSDNSQEPQGAVRLRDNNGTTQRNGNNGNDQDNGTDYRQPPYVPGEFELFVNRLVQSVSPTALQQQAQQQAQQQSQPQTQQPSQQQGQNTVDRNQRDGRPRDAEGRPLKVLRFGAELLTNVRGNPQDYAPQVPSDYLISPGDELVVAMWGSVDANLRLTVDRAGRITIPRVGAVLVSGVRYADVANVIRQQVAQVFRNFQISVSLGQLRNIRIYVTGFTPQPGSYTVSSLSTIVNAVMRTGGPSAAGSFRNIRLVRGGREVTTFDLYDLLLRGDTSADRVLQADDVIQIGAVGPQVAVIGSVNKPAIFELRNGETVSDVLRMAAGFTAVADRTRLTVERLVDRDNVRINQLSLPRDEGTHPSSGDVMRAFSLVDSVLPVERQNKLVQVEGEVVRPGGYVLPAGSTVNDALKAAGGLTPGAYLFGTEFSRESVRVRQQENYDRALRDLETQFTLAVSTQRTSSADEAQAQNARGVGTGRLIERLRAARPTGRIVLQMEPQAQSLPDLALEDGDRLYVPARPQTVGVFGSVYNGGSYLYAQGRPIGDYLHLAGGPTRGADSGSTFIVRANGTVISSRQSGGWFGLGGSFASVAAEPGDTIFVPEEIDKTTWVQNAKDWTQILYQFGLGVAAYKSLGN